MRRFTRLTNAFSKKIENHAHMVALYTLWYNFVRIHKTLRVTSDGRRGRNPVVVNGRRSEALRATGTSKAWHLQAARAEGCLMPNFIWLAGLTLGLFLNLIGFGFWLFPHHYLDGLALFFGVPGMVLLVGAYLGRP